MSRDSNETRGALTPSDESASPPGGTPDLMAEASRVLVVDDNRLHRELARDAIMGLAQVESCGDGVAALRALEREPADLVISDLSMPGMSGLELLAQVRRLHPGTDFVLLTAHASTDSAIEALRMGACDYLRKPIDEHELAIIVQRTLDRRQLLAENSNLRDALATVEGCRALTPCLEPAEVVPVALDLILRLLGRERGIALLRRESVPMAEGVTVVGFRDGTAGQLRELLSREKSIDLEGMSDIQVLDRSPLHGILGDAGIASERVLVIPVHGEDSVAAALWILEGERPFDSADLERARVVAGHAHLCLRNAERYNQAKERAFLDDVTELYNARYLLAATEHEIRRAERYGTTLSILFLDVDRFKLVNDNHGHLVGSNALRQLARLLGQCVRQVDTLARYGGDEFTILLTDTDEEVGMQVAERIRRTVLTTPFESGSGEPLSLTVSLGLATYPRHGRSWETLLDLSDKAMYRAKSRGRNQVCSASDLDD